VVARKSGGFGQKNYFGRRSRRSSFQILQRLGCQWTPSGKVLRVTCFLLAVSRRSNVTAFTSEWSFETKFSFSNPARIPPIIWRMLICSHTPKELRRLTTSYLPPLRRSDGNVTSPLPPRNERTYANSSNQRDWFT